MPENLSERGVLSGPIRRLAVALAILIPLTSSFDIFLIVNAGGNFRFCQMIAAALFVLAIIKLSRKKMFAPLGIIPLCFWLSFQCAFIPATDFWPKSVAYCLWLALNVATIFSYVQIFGDDASALNVVLRWYIYSFAIIAGLGVLQFAMPLAGLPGLLVTQWWIPGNLARANGFSYEPSYFASYLLIGFVFSASLRRAGSQLLSRRVLSGICWLTAAGIIVSSSRMGIVFLALDILLAHAMPWFSVFGDFARFRMSPSKMRALGPSALLLVFVAFLTAGGAMALQRNPTIVLMFLNGTGLSDTAAHSVLQRENAFEETLTVFMDHPFVGRSLGGVSAAIADLNGERIKSFEESKTFEGMNILAEILAASGVVGFVPFLWFLVTTIKKPLQMAAISPHYYSSILRALVRSLLFALAILQFNQNVLRPYLWVHIAILASVYAAARRAVIVRARPSVKHLSV